MRFSFNLCCRTSLHFSQLLHTNTGPQTHTTLTSLQSFQHKSHTTPGPVSHLVRLVGCAAEGEGRCRLGIWGGAGHTGQLLCLSPWSLAHCSLLLSRSRSLSETRIRSRRHESVQTPGNGDWGILSLKCPDTQLQCIDCQPANIQWTLVSCYPKDQIITIVYTNRHERICQKIKENV